MKRLVTISIIGVAVACSGCATMLNQETGQVAIMSTPGDAEYEVKNEYGATVHRGITPESVTLAKGNGYFDGADYTLTFTKPGYAPAVEHLRTSVGGVYALGNLVFGGLIGYLFVDPATGAMWSFDRDEVNAALAPSE